MKRCTNWIILVVMVVVAILIANDCTAQISTNPIPGSQTRKTKIKNKATYGHSRGTYQPKSFYSGRRSPKKKTNKNMPVFRKRK